MIGPHKLQHFVDAQEPAYAAVLAELEAGKKRSHWMWFIFPQIKGLGMSEMAVRFAIYSLDEAKAYLGHPVLGARLLECTETVLAVKHSTVEQIFGYPDDMKFRSSMTLFAKVAEKGSIFEQALGR